MRYFSINALFFGCAIALSALGSLPASAQVRCPPSFYYRYGYGCIPASDAYSDMYGGDYGYDSPAYDGYGLAFGFAGSGHFRGGGSGSHAGGHIGGAGGHAGGGGRRR
jgi:hypothetical protein